MTHRYKGLNNLNSVKLTSSLFRQLRHAEVVNTPATVFGGHKNNWGKKCTSQTKASIKPGLQMCRAN